MNSPFVRKVAYGLLKAVTAPKSSLSWVLRGHQAKDPVFIRQSYWYTGTLPRVPLAEFLPASREVDVTLPRCLDRKSDTSITPGEACCIGAVVRSTAARKILEIGTFDGNTTLVLAANVAAGGEVVTMDLPPDFEDAQKDLLAFPDVALNLTPRDQLGRQYRNHPLSASIRQIYGDSAEVDWSRIGGPFDLIFIDGCHSSDYVRSDSENALSQLSPGGTVIWHDYGMIDEVSDVVDAFVRENPRLKASAVEGTRLAIAVAAD